MDFLTVFRLVTATIFPVLIAMGLYLVDKKTAFGKIKYFWKQIIVGGIYGICAILATVFGVPAEGAVLNVRSASPLIAGLVFGGPSGLIAGVIGAIHRIYYGGYTWLACSLGTLFAGIFGASCRKFMFDNKKASGFYGFSIGLTTEVLHMVLVFLTHLDDIDKVIGIMKICALPMIVCNALSVMIAMILIRVIGKEKIVRVKGEKKQISQLFQLFLLICIAVAFVVTQVFMFAVETNVSKSDAENLLRTNLDDVKQSVQDAIDKGGDIDSSIMQSVKNRHVGESGIILVCNKDFEVVGDSDHMGEMLITSPNKKIDQGKMFAETVYGKKSFCMYGTVGENAVYYVVTTIPQSECMKTRDIVVYVMAFMEILIFATLFVRVYLLIKSLVVDNIHKVNTSLAQITGGNLDVSVDVRGNEEFASLSDDINQTVATLKRYISEAETRINKELEFAMQIQKSVLPRKFPAFPNNDEFDIYATMNPAKEVGGDFYDYFMIDDDRLVFTIADVSGKGIPGAMCMMRSKTILKDLIERGLPIDLAFTKANERLCQDNEAGMFVTVWGGTLNIRTGQLCYVNAGHNPPLIKNGNGDFEYLRTRPNFILAGMEGVKYKKHELEIKPNSKIFLYTDGITEATDGNKCLYGEERLVNYLNAHKTDGLKETLSGLTADIDGFVGDVEQFDDMTMLILEYRDGNKEVLEERQFKAVDENLPKCLEFIEEMLEKADCSMKIQTQISVCVEEMFVNVAHYAYGDSQGDISVKAGVNHGIVKIILTDEGVAFNPLAKTDPDITLTAEERGIGGLGIFMVKKSMDYVAYERIDNKNVFTMKKKI